MTKWLFTMEYVGETDWKRRNNIVKLYKENVQNGFVNINSSCGISKSDFDMMKMELEQAGVRL